MVGGKGRGGFSGLYRRDGRISIDYTVDGVLKFSGYIAQRGFRPPVVENKRGESGGLWVASRLTGGDLPTSSAKV